MLSVELEFLAEIMETTGHSSSDITSSARVWSKRIRDALWDTTVCFFFRIFCNKLIRLCLKDRERYVCLRNQRIRIQVFHGRCECSGMVQYFGSDPANSTPNSRYSHSHISVSLIETIRRTGGPGNTSCPRAIHIMQREVLSKESGQCSSHRDGIVLSAHLLQRTARHSMSTMVGQAGPFPWSRRLS